MMARARPLNILPQPPKKKLELIIDDEQDVIKMEKPTSKFQDASDHNPNQDS